MIDWKQLEDGREKYQAYLCSENWAWRRGAIKERCDGMCEKCHAMPMQHVHHLTYVRKYREELTDLIGICEPCHSKVHAIRDQEPAVKTIEKRAWVTARISIIASDGYVPANEVAHEDLAHSSKGAFTTGEDRQAND